jgi:tricorn protease interacting factor F2/3
MWDWYISRMAAIEKFHPMIYERIVATIIPAAGIENPGDVTAFFKDYMARTTKAGDVIRLSLEKLKINLQMRNSA